MSGYYIVNADKPAYFQKRLANYKTYLEADGIAQLQPFGQVVSNSNLQWSAADDCPGDPAWCTGTDYDYYLPSVCASNPTDCGSFGTCHPSLNPNLKVSNCAATSVHKSHVVHRMRRDLVNLPYSRNERAIASSSCDRI